MNELTTRLLMIATEPGTGELASWSNHGYRYVPTVCESCQALVAAITDAVLAVLIPADQVRAETLEALRRDLREADQTPWHVLDTIEARAAEYRKAAAA